MTDLTPAVVTRAFLDALAIGETEPDQQGKTPKGYGYNILVGSTLSHPVTFDSYKEFPVWDGWHFVDSQGRTSVSHAAGRYQFEPATWRTVAAFLKLNDFTPASQDQGAWYLAQEEYHRLTGRQLIGDLMAMSNLDRIAQLLRPTWASLSSTTFPMRFAAAINQDDSPVSVTDPPGPAMPPPGSVVVIPPAPPQPTTTTTTVPQGPHPVATGTVGGSAAVAVVTLLFNHGILTAADLAPAGIVLAAICSWLAHLGLKSTAGTSTVTTST